MLNTDKTSLINLNEIEEPALKALHNSNALLMALEGFGKHAMNPGDEIKALTELALEIRGANADLVKLFGLDA